MWFILFSLRRLWVDQQLYHQFILVRSSRLLSQTNLLRHMKLVIWFYLSKRIRTMCTSRTMLITFVAFPRTKSYAIRSEWIGDTTQHSLYAWRRRFACIATHTQTCPNFKSHARKRTSRHWICRVRYVYRWRLCFHRWSIFHVPMRGFSQKKQPLMVMIRLLNTENASSLQIATLIWVPRKSLLVTWELQATSWIVFFTDWKSKNTMRRYSREDYK